MAVNQVDTSGCCRIYLSWFPIVQFDPLMPLVDVVGVLTQQYAVEQEGPPGNQLLKTSEPKLQVDVVWKKWNKTSCNIIHSYGPF